MTLLQHIRIPSIAPRFPTYSRAVELQSKLQSRLLEYKASLSSPSPKPAPPPFLISFTPAPTYTLGRRQTGPLSRAEEDRLRAPLKVSYADPETNTTRWRSYEPEVVNAPRGGLATYHGPGQVVFWPVIDLHSPYHRHFTVRDYACLLEKTTIAALAKVSQRKDGAEGIRGFTTDNPGVWVKHHPAGLWSPERASKGQEEKAEERKISALGVHLRRHVTGLGVAVNVGMPVTGSEETNPWGRIVACGLEDKGVTNMLTELHGSNHNDELHSGSGEGLQEQLRRTWAEEFEQRLGASNPYNGSEDPDTAEIMSSLGHDAHQVEENGWYAGRPINN